MSSKIDKNIMNMLSFVALGKIFQGTKILPRGEQKKIKKIRINKMLFIDLKDPKVEHSLLVINSDFPKDRFHIIKKIDNEIPIVVATKDKTEQTIKRHGRMDNKKFLSLFRSLVRGYVFDHPNKLEISNQEFAGKEVVLFDPTIIGVNFDKKDELSLKIEYREETVLFEEIDLHKKRIGVIDDGSNTSFLAIRNGEMFCYDWKEMDELALKVAPLVNASFNYKNAMYSNVWKNQPEN